MRWPRDFRRGRLYGVTQRGNNGQWIYIDKQDFLWALALMRKYAVRYAVLVHGWCLMHNHGHWIFEASDEESISNLMRDMQSQYSRYLNLKYRKRPWVLLGKLGTKKPRGFTRYLRSGPVNWTPRFDSEWLADSAGLASFLRYIELNPVRAKLCKRPERWAWSSAAAHLAGTDEEGLLCLDRWRELFGAPSKIEEVWREYLNGPIVEEKANALRIRTWTGSVHNRPRGWVAPECTMSAGSSPAPMSG